MVLGPTDGDVPMKKIGMALLAGGLLMGTAVTAMAQDVAALVPPPKSEFMVFADRGSHALSPTAVATVRAAAIKAGEALTLTFDDGEAKAAALGKADGKPVRETAKKPGQGDLF